VSTEAREEKLQRDSEERLEIELSHRRCSGLTKLKYSFARALRGVLGGIIMRWRETGRQEKAQMLYDKISFQKGSQKLKATFVKMLKGEAAFRLHLWQRSFQVENLTLSIPTLALTLI